MSYVTYLFVFILAYLYLSRRELIPLNVGVLFPLFMITGLVTRRWAWLYEPIFAGSVALLSFRTILFANGYWLM